MFSDVCGLGINKIVLFSIKVLVLYKGLILLSAYMNPKFRTELSHKSYFKHHKYLKNADK